MLDRRRRVLLTRLTAAFSTSAARSRLWPGPRRVFCSLVLEFSRDSPLALPLPRLRPRFSSLLRDPPPGVFISSEWCARDSRNEAHLCRPPRDSVSLRRPGLWSLHECAHGAVQKRSPLKYVEHSFLCKRVALMLIQICFIVRNRSGSSALR